VTISIAEVDSGVSDTVARLVFLAIATLGVGALVYSHLFLGGVSI